MFSLLSHRQQDLYRILKAYTIYRPDEGYCQAQAPVAAVLLMHMPAEVRGRRGPRACQKAKPSRSWAVGVFLYSCGCVGVLLNQKEP